MTTEELQAADEELRGARTITEILDSAHGKALAANPRYYASMQKQAQLIGEELPERHRPKQAEVK